MKFSPEQQERIINQLRYGLYPKIPRLLASGPLLLAAKGWPSLNKEKMRAHLKAAFGRQ